MTADERERVRVARDAAVRARVGIPPDPRWRNRSSDNYERDRENTRARRRVRWATDPEYRDKRLRSQYRRRARLRAEGVSDWWRR